jgi:hypothetical protein
MLLIAFDAYHSQNVRTQFLVPSIWATVYVAGALTTFWFVATGTLRALQVMTAVVAFIGLFRGWAFVFYDGRLSPLGLNTMIACYAYLAHKYERGRMVAEIC